MSVLSFFYRALRQEELEYYKSSFSKYKHTTDFERENE